MSNSRRGRPSLGERKRVRVHAQIVEQLWASIGRPNLPENTAVSDVLCLLLGQDHLAEVLVAEDLPQILSPEAFARFAELARRGRQVHRPGQAELFNAAKVPA